MRHVDTRYAPCRYSCRIFFRASSLTCCFSAALQSRYAATPKDARCRVGARICSVRRGSRVQCVHLSINMMTRAPCRREAYAQAAACGLLLRAPDILFHNKTLSSLLLCYAHARVIYSCHTYRSATIINAQDLTRAAAARCFTALRRQTCFFAALPSPCATRGARGATATRS